MGPGGGVEARVVPCDPLPGKTGWGFACGSRTVCQEPGCYERSVALCDWPLANGHTCDRRMCAHHRHPVGRDLDYCTPHYQRTDAGVR